MNPKRSKSRNGGKMPMMHPNAAAIDVGATMHMAAVRADRAPEPVRSFGTFTADLHRLVDWFTECGVETVVMESTSVYWIPIFELLDARGFTVFLVNARDAKHVPGRKTDVSDAQWLQRLHSFGLLRASFRPKGQIAELASLRASARASAGVRGLTHPTYAEGLDGDESSAAPRRRRHHRRDRPAYHTRDPCRRARS
jgi:transposase